MRCDVQVFNVLTSSQLKISLAHEIDSCTYLLVSEGQRSLSEIHYYKLQPLLRRKETVTRN